VFIADGHHRYETALAFRDEMRRKHGNTPAAAYEHVLMFLCNMDDEGIVILPTHRGSTPCRVSTQAFLAKVRSHLPVETRSGSPEDAMRAVDEAAGKEGDRLEHRRRAGSCGHLPDLRGSATRGWQVSPQLRPLDVVLLHGFLLEDSWGSLRGGDRGTVREILQGTAKAAATSPPGDPGRLLPQSRVDRGVPDVSLSARPPAEGHLLLPEDRDGLLIFPCREMTGVPG